MCNEAMAVTEVRENLSEVINRVAFGKERVSLTRKNKAVAYMIPVEDMELLEMLEDKIDLWELEKDLMNADAEPNVSWEELKLKLEK